MSDFKAQITFPAWAIQNTNARQNFRNVMQARMRRQLAKMADQAASRTPYERIASAFAVHQITEGNTLTMWVENHDPKFGYIEGDVPPHQMPGQEPHNAPMWKLASWAESHGVSLFFIWNKIATRGVDPYIHPGYKGKHILQSAWDNGQDELMESIEEGYSTLIEKWGAV